MITITKLECQGCFAELFVENTEKQSIVECVYCTSTYVYEPPKNETGHMYIDGDLVGGDKITGSKIQIGNISGTSGVSIGRGSRVTVKNDKVNGQTVTFNQSGQTVNGVQINSGDDITIGNISGVSGLAIGRGANVVVDGDFVGGDKITGDKIVMDGNFSGNNVNVNSWIK